ncbi:unnamed protein product [Debaryomyces fabryi]|nr:unnamed protein product [Debaryomyces fabryi]
MKRAIQRYIRFRKISLIVMGTLLFIVSLQFFNFLNHNSLPLELFDNDNVDTNKVIVDIKVQKCFKFRECNTALGWHRLSKPLNMFSRSFTIFDTHLIVKREQINQATRIMTDFQITSGPVAPKGDGWVQESYKNLILWKQYTNTNSAEFESAQLIREVNILFGDKDLHDSRIQWDFQYQESPMPFGTLLPVHLSLFKLSRSEEQEYIQNYTDFSVRKREGNIITDKSNFRIMQISDLHFSSDYEICNDSGCKLDTKTLKFIEDSLESDNIDFVVITGDLIDQIKVKDFKSVILKGLSPILRKNIPFIFTFGELDFNEFHNKNASLIKFQILQFLSSLPNCYNYVPNQDNHIHGLTNYNLKLLRNLDSKPSAILTILDSENQKIDASQINSLYRLNRDLPQNLFKLLFFHYPLPNFRPTGKFKLVGSYNEKHQLNAKTSHNYRDDIVNCGYNVISVGHEHENDACVLSEKYHPETKESLNEIWLCYSGITGDSGVTKLNQDFDRKIRVFEILFDNKRLISWKKSMIQGIGFDYQIIHQFV